MLTGSGSCASQDSTVRDAGTLESIKTNTVS